MHGLKEYDISSTQNPRIKSVLHLQKRRERDRTGLFLIEGTRELARALRGGVTIEEIFRCPPLTASTEKKDLVREIESRRIAMTSVSQRVFARIAYRETTGGLLAVARKPSFTIADLPRTDPPLYLVVESVEKPGNLGAIFRSADGAGATGLIVTDQRTDLSNPNTIRASLGTVFTVSSAITDSATAIEWLKNNSVAIVTTSPHADTPYTRANLATGCAIVVGSEDTGVSESWLEAADERVRIPMRGAADSLNVAAAAAVLLYEALRQRTAGRIR